MGVADTGQNRGDVAIFSVERLAALGKLPQSDESRPSIVETVSFGHDFQAASAVT